MRARRGRVWNRVDIKVPRPFRFEAFCCTFEDASSACVGGGPIYVASSKIEPKRPRSSILETCRTGLDDPHANVVRDQPAQSWVGEGNAGATEDFEALTATSGAVIVHYVCQIHDHCVNGQRVTVYVRKPAMRKVG